MYTYCCNVRSWGISCSKISVMAFLKSKYFPHPLKLSFSLIYRLFSWWTRALFGGHLYFMINLRLCKLSQFTNIYMLNTIVASVVAVYMMGEQTVYIINPSVAWDICLHIMFVKSHPGGPVFPPLAHNTQGSPAVFVQRVLPVCSPSPRGNTAVGNTGVLSMWLLIWLWPVIWRN